VNHGSGGRNGVQFGGHARLRFGCSWKYAGSEMCRSPVFGRSLGQAFRRHLSIRHRRRIGRHKPVGRPELIEVKIAKYLCGEWLHRGSGCGVFQARESPHRVQWAACAGEATSPRATVHRFVTANAWPSEKCDRLASSLELQSTGERLADKNAQ